MTDELMNVTSEDMNTGLTFDTSDLTFDTGNAVLDGVLNVGVRVAIVTGGVILGNLLCFGGKKGIEAAGSAIEKAKAKKAEEKKAEEQPEVVNADGTAAN